MTSRTGASHSGEGLEVDDHQGARVEFAGRLAEEFEQGAYLAKDGQRLTRFAVLGGAFAEGIDLPNERLIGAFVATLGLPPVNPVNAEIARRSSAPRRGVASRPLALRDGDDGRKVGGRTRSRPLPQRRMPRGRR